MVADRVLPAAIALGGVAIGAPQRVGEVSAGAVPSNVGFHLIYPDRWNTGHHIPKPKPPPHRRRMRGARPSHPCRQPVASPPARVAQPAHRRRAAVASPAPTRRLAVAFPARTRGVPVVSPRNTAFRVSFVNLTSAQSFEPSTLA